MKSIFRHWAVSSEPALRTLDLMRSDGANLLLLWIGGGFRSRKFPVTWKFNGGHENVRHDFAGRLIRHAHRCGLKVLLGFTLYDRIQRLCRVPLSGLPRPIF